MKPPISYFGGKTRLAPAIAALLPEHQHYVEPYGGSLAVLLAKTPAPHETVNDLDDALMTFWRVLRDQPEELARAVDADHQPFSDAVWQELVNGFAADAYTYRSGGGLPGERRTNWTREDYKS